MSIENTALLFMQDVGRVPRGANPGQFGAMNWGLIQYEDDAGEKPNEGEIDELAALYKVGGQTVRRWFGIPGDKGVSYGNCVPLAVLGAPPRFGKPETHRRRVCNCTADQQRRIFLAACLAAGGLVRADPIYTKSDRAGNVLRYEEDPEECGSLAEAVRYVESLYNGNEYDRNGLPLSLAWVAITIEGQSDAWQVNVTRTYPADGDDSDDFQCDNAEQGEGDL